MTTRNNQERETGLKAVGRVRWGSHFCIFYETKTDLLDILVPFFKCGLTANEFCLWVVAPHEFTSVAEATDALSKAWPGVDRHLRDKKMDIITYPETFRVNGSFEASKAVACYRRKLVEAERRGFNGLRANGSSAWVRENLGATKFCDYECVVDTLMANRRMIAACTFPLMLSGAEQILDAARTHQFAVTVRKGVWKRVEIGDIQAARREAQQATPKLEQLGFRQREILQRIAEGQNTKEIAALFGISVKTVEAHRLQLMRRLKIDNVPGLVRFAIRTGLVSADT